MPWLIRYKLKNKTCLCISSYPLTKRHNHFIEEQENFTQLNLLKFASVKIDFRPSLFFSKLSARHNLAICWVLKEIHAFNCLCQIIFNVKTYDIVCSSPEAENFWWEYSCRIHEFRQGGGDKEEKSDRCW